MSVIYSEEEFLKLFDEINVMNKEIGEVEYTLSAEKENLLFHLHILPFDDYASVTLVYKDQQGWLLDVGVENLHSIVCDNQGLKFYKHGNAERPALTVSVKPRISLQCRAATPRKED